MITKDQFTKIIDSICGQCVFELSCTPGAEEFKYIKTIAPHKLGIMMLIVPRLEVITQEKSIYDLLALTGHARFIEIAIDANDIAVFKSFAFKGVGHEITAIGFDLFNAKEIARVVQMAHKWIYEGIIPNPVEAPIILN